MKRSKDVTVYKYQCPISGESFKRYRKAPAPEELISVKAYYQLNADKDDRPMHIRKMLGELSENSQKDISDASSTH